MATTITRDNANLVGHWGQAIAETGDTIALISDQRFSPTAIQLTPDTDGTISLSYSLLNHLDRDVPLHTFNPASVTSDTGLWQDSVLGQLRAEFRGAGGTIQFFNQSQVPKIVDLCECPPVRDSSADFDLAAAGHGLGSATIGSTTWHLNTPSVGNVPSLTARAYNASDNSRLAAQDIPLLSDKTWYGCFASLDTLWFLHQPTPGQSIAYAYNPTSKARVSSKDLLLHNLIPSFYSVTGGFLQGDKFWVTALTAEAGSHARAFNATTLARSANDDFAIERTAGDAFDVYGAQRADGAIWFGGLLGSNRYGLAYKEDTKARWNSRDLTLASGLLYVQASNDNHLYFSAGVANARLTAYRFSV